MEYTVDPAVGENGEPAELVLVQYDHHSPGALEFRERLLTAIDRHHKQLDIVSAHYYDDAIWIYSAADFSKQQIELIESLAAQTAAPGAE